VVTAAAAAVATTNDGMTRYKRTSPEMSIVADRAAACDGHFRKSLQARGRARYRCSMCPVPATARALFAGRWSLSACPSVAPVLPPVVLG